MFAGAALTALMTVPISKTKKKEQKKETKRGDNPAAPQHPPSFYTLDLDAMREMKYPVPRVTPEGELAAPDGFVWTAQPPVEDPSSRVSLQ